MPTQSEERWRVAQSKEDGFWKKNGVLSSQMERVLSRYAPLIDEISMTLTPDSKIIDVGCGPTCAGQLFEKGVKTYLDPLMNSYLSAHANELPNGEKIAATAEHIPKEANTYDVVICVNALDHMINPEKALVEIQRILNKEGIFMLGLFLHPPVIAAARQFIEKWLPFFREEAYPYSYTLNTIRRDLEKLFSIQRMVRVYRKDTAIVPSLHREDWMFICKKKA